MLLQQIISSLHLQNPMVCFLAGPLQIEGGIAEEHHVLIEHHLQTVEFLSPNGPLECHLNQFICTRWIGSSALKQGQACVSTSLDAPVFNENSTSSGPDVDTGKLECLQVLHSVSKSVHLCPGW